MNSRKDKKRLRVSKRILRAARKIVIENGFDRVSLRAIARRIDYSPAALYEYYPGEYLASSKDDQEPPSTIRDLR